MDIRKQLQDGILEVRVSGRLDSHWSAQLTSELNEVIREGARHIRLNMADVQFMSSTGMRVLLSAFKQLKALQGSFLVTEPSDQVRSVLELSGFEKLLSLKATTQTAEKAPGSEKLLKNGLIIDLFRESSVEPMRCRMVGHPDQIESSGESELTIEEVSLPRNVLSLGIAAFGNDAADCRGRFGEFLAAAGVAACRATDEESGAPDFLIASGPFVPRAHLLYGAVCTGDLSILIRFETEKGNPHAGLTALMRTALDVAQSEAVGFVMVAESAGLIGASLRQSPPLLKERGTFFSHPALRRRLSFTPERVHKRDLAIVAGIVAAPGNAKMAPFLRPLGADQTLLGHCHAVVLPYRPLPMGSIKLTDTIPGLFEGVSPQNVMHLLSDDRDIVGGGDSEFVRGAIWCGPLDISEQNRALQNESGAAV